MNPMNKQLDSCISVFPKFLNKAGVELEAEILASLGFQQADLMIREGLFCSCQIKGGGV